MANASQWGNHPNDPIFVGLDKELNALASGGRKLGHDLDNGTHGFTDCDIQVILAEPPGARSAGAHIIVTFLKSADGGETFSDGSDTVTPSVSNQQIVFAFAADATAQCLVLHAPVPNGYFRPHVTNNTGAAFADTGNSVRMAFYNGAFSDVLSGS
jgi:hypothetical protein